VRHPPRYRKAIAAFAAAALLAGGAYYYFVQVQLPRFETVREGVLYRSGQPRALGMHWIQARGIRTVVGLRLPEKKGTIEATRHAAENGMRYVNIPLGPSTEELSEAAREFLEIVEDESNWPVLVHCGRGKERAGVMSAVYRIEHDGWTNEEALEEGFELGMTRGRMPIAEAFILDYRPEGSEEAPAGPSGGLPEVPWIEID
jgi:protein tyrosine/serine phosphatase